MDSVDGLFLLVPTTNPKPFIPNFHRLWIILHESQMVDSSKLFYYVLNLPQYYSAAYDCSMTKKRRAEEQALGVPVNKRKSLLMKPRHYSPNIDCKEEHDHKTEAEEDDGLLETNDHPTTGSRKEWPKIYLLPSTKTSLNFCRTYSLFGCKILSSLQAKPIIYFTQHPFIEG